MLPVVSPFAKLITVAVFAILDIVMFIWGIDLMPLRDAQIIGVIITLLLAGAGMVVPSLPGLPGHK